MELSLIGQEVRRLRVSESLVVHTDGIAGYGLQTDTADCRHLRAEVGLQQALRQTDALEDFRAAVAADGGYSHLRHNLEQTLLHSFYIVGFCRFVVFLNLAALHKVVEDGVGEIRTECRCAVTEQQCCVHNLTNLAALHDKRGLNALAHADEIVVYGTHGEQTRNGCVCLIHSAVGQNDVVIALVNAAFCVMTELVERVAKSVLALAALENHR